MARTRTQSAVICGSARSSYSGERFPTVSPLRGPQIPRASSGYSGDDPWPLLRLQSTANGWEGTTVAGFTSGVRGDVVVVASSWKNYRGDRRDATRKPYTQVGAPVIRRSWFSARRSASLDEAPRIAREVGDDVRAPRGSDTVRGADRWDCRVGPCAGESA